jgi:hypothetical protein
MKKIIICLSALLLIVGCSSTPDYTPKLINNDKKILDLLDYFKDYGFKIDHIQPLVSEHLHAEEAFAASIDGQEIGIYRFDLKFDKAKKKVSRTIQTKTFYIQATPFKAIVNGSFIVVNCDKHLRGKEIAKVFKLFPKKLNL